jgi:hypothetical protein
MASDYINIEADLNGAIEQVVAELPQEVARLEKKRGKDGGIALSIIPANPHAAPMGAHAENGLNWLISGLGNSVQHGSYRSRVKTRVRLRRRFLPRCNNCAEPFSTAIVRKE